MPSLIKVLKTITGHPLNRNNKLNALIRFLKWQISVRINPYPVVYRFAEKSKLIIKRGQTGATGNLYCGLHEFEDMSFVLHFLRQDDLFVDVGANIGSYTILAGSEVGAETISIEPLPTTFEMLKQNIAVNNIQSNVRALNIGLGDKTANLKFTKSLDVINHVATESDKETIDVPVEIFDHVVGRLPKTTVVKIDVEGYETMVLNGMSASLIDSNLAAIIIELNGSGKRYGFDDNKIHEKLLQSGFRACQYFPFERRIQIASGIGHHNTIYIRDVDKAQQRVKAARRVRIFNYSI